MTKRKASKLVRMLSAEPFAFCGTGLKLVRRVYGKKTLQQAWRAATTEHLINVLEPLGVKAPLHCGMCSPETSCFYGMKTMEPSEFRKRFRSIPKALQNAYAKA